jgi:hypothetical protein
MTVAHDASRHAGRTSREEGQATMAKRDTSTAGIAATADLAAQRPAALETYRALLARKKVGKTEPGQTARMKAAREILVRSGGIPAE